MKPPRSGRLNTTKAPLRLAVPPPEPQWRRAMSSHLGEVVTDGSVSELERVAALRTATLAIIHVPDSVAQYELPEIRPGEPIPDVATTGGYLELVRAGLVERIAALDEHIARLVELDTTDVAGCEDEPGGSEA